MRAAACVAGLVLLCGCSRLVILNDPLTAAEHNDLGVAYESAGKPELAERQYRAALHRDHRLTRAWVNLGNLEAARQRWSPAERCYRRALRVAPDDRDALNNLAMALLRGGRDLDEAERLARRAVEQPGGSDSLYRSTLDEVRRARRTRGSR